MLKKVKSQVKAHLSDRSDSISIISFLSTFRRACDANHIHEEAAMRVLSFFVKNTFATTIDSRMSAAPHIAPVFATVNTVEPTTQKEHFCFYPEVSRYLLKKFDNDLAIAVKDYAILR